MYFSQSGFARTIIAFIWHIFYVRMHELCNSRTVFTGTCLNCFVCFILECAYSLLRKTVLVHLPRMRQVCLIFSSEITHGQTACVQSCSLVEKESLGHVCFFVIYGIENGGAQCHKYELFLCAPPFSTKTLLNMSH